jgi:hypothetical protein
MNFLPLLLAIFPAFPLAQSTPSPISPAATPTAAPTNTVCNAIATSGNTQYTYTIVLAPDKLKPTTISVFKRVGSPMSGAPLLRNGNLTSYEQDAPDADYSFPPFDREFRGEPNNGEWIYRYRGSVNGLFVSALPKTGTVQRVQVVHYLSRNSAIKSSPATCG